MKGAAHYGSCMQCSPKHAECDAVMASISFTLAGRAFDMSDEDVRTRVAKYRPEVIDRYWVEIDGERWPVKQVMAIMTGLDRTRFLSQNSRRLLAKLGFAVGTGRTELQGGSSAQAQPRHRTPFDIESFPTLEQLQVNVDLTWRLAGQIALDPDGFPKFPALPRHPGLYRFDFGIGDDGIRTLYIGESKSLARRAGNYRNAKTDRSTQRTSRRIHKEIVTHLAGGGVIDVAIATEVRSDNGTIDLRRTADRRFAENAAVFIAQITGSTRVLNVDAGLEGAVDPEGDSASELTSASRRSSELTEGSVDHG